MPRLLPLAALAPALLVLGACSTDPEPTTAQDSGGGQQGVTVNATDDACEVSPTTFEAGIETFAISNAGTQVSEVYVYAEGDRIVTEKENIGPGTSYELTVDLAEGEYAVACKPGMVGDGIRQAITVTAAAQTTAADPQAVQAVTDYRAYVQTQADALPALVQGLRDAIAAGDREQAMALYAPSRVPWERIEPVAESFGDLDPRMDAREADLAEGEQFTGWHRLEKALWTGEDLAPMVPVADQLLADVVELQQRTPNAALTPTSIGNGAKELLDEVSTGKVTGEEEAFSHTDLWDFQANVEGAQQAFTDLRPLVEADDEKNGTDLAGELDTQFATVLGLLQQYREGDGFVSYDTVPQEQRQELSRAVDALSEPLSRLAAAAAGQ
ncbi:MAG: iron uptake system protein EfeO [Actinomycetales bacterium]